MGVRLRGITEQMPQAVRTCEDEGFARAIPPLEASFIQNSFYFGMRTPDGVSWSVAYIPILKSI